ncbi:MAG: ribosome biogenesis GTPase YlqF [Tissierellia bacterium]|nr:ribosome biogenesis GTPase YlqF [Tissierellia bacterium]
MKINWYPGHMKKTLENIKESQKLVDFYIEIIDARIPSSSSNPLLKEVLKNKKRLILINKADLADPEENQKWLNYFNQDLDTNALLYNATKRDNINKLLQASIELNQELLDHKKKKGMKDSGLRAMVVGIPNSGKSTFINTFVGKRSTKTGNRPGVTRSNQWIRIHKKLDLLDTPGVLWPKFSSETMGLHLAFVGSIKEEILDRETLALELIKELKETYPNLLSARYDLQNIDVEPLKLMDEIGRKRGAILKGGFIDYERTSRVILDDFKNGMIGPITLEKVENYG